MSNCCLCPETDNIAGYEMNEQAQDRLISSDSTVIRDDNCFCCGKDNTKGLKLTFSATGDGDEGVRTRLVIPDWLSGWKQMTHGGLLSMLLDETMAHACINKLGHAITAELSVRYHNPVQTGTEITVVGKVEKTRSRIVETSGVISDLNGLTIATAKARFLLVAGDMESPAVLSGNL
ncbi:MAG: PaaI family thioesterase [Spirochaetales bacterium]|jgi:uncharacterized protein (TIGR00369 family)|nr:PaaI family thioesterase [Spirochaetales bacterium]